MIRVAVFLLVVSITGAAQKKKSLTLPDAILHVGPSVVSIECIFDHLPDQTSKALGQSFYRWVCGSGFLVNKDGYVITALHVVEKFEKTNTVPVLREGQSTTMPLGIGRLDAGFPLHVDQKDLQMRESMFDLEVQVVDRDVKHDIALLKTIRSPFPRPNRLPIAIREVERPNSLPRFEPLNAPAPALAIFDTNRPTEGEAIAVSGYPLYGLAMKTNAGVISSAWATDGSRGHEDPADTYVTDMRVNPGDSGGPVYLVRNGAVIGLCDSFNDAFVTDTAGNQVTGGDGKPLIYNSGLANVIPAKYIVELLSKNKVKWSEVH